MTSAPDRRRGSAHGNEGPPAIEPADPLGHDLTGDLGQESPLEEVPEPRGPRHAVRGLGISFSTSVLVQVFGVVTGVVLARALGATDRGELAAAILWPSVFAALATLGMQEAATFHVAREPAAVGRVIGSGLALVLLQSLVFSAVCGALLPLVLGSHPGGTVAAAFLYLLYIPLTAVGTLMVGILNGSLHYRFFNAVRLALGLSVLMAQALLLALGDLTVGTMVVGYIVSIVGVVVLACALVARSRPGRLQLDRRMVRSLFNYGIRSHASSMSSQLNQRLDQMLISIFLPARQLGLYVAATTLSSLPGTIGLTVAFVALPEVARLPPGPERTQLATRLISMTLLASVVVAVPAALAAPLLIKLFFGASFAAAGEVTRILAVAVIWYSTTRAIEAVLRAVGRPLDAGIAEFIALGATVLSLAVLIPLAGIVGAGLASLVAYAVAGFWMARRAAAALDSSWYRLLLPDRGGVQLLTALIRRVRHTRRA